MPSADALQVDRTVSHANLRLKKIMEEEASYDPYIERECATYGWVRPPWLYKNAHPYDGLWRQGGGEGHCIAFGRWWKRTERSVDERLDLVRAWKPPVFWWPWCGMLVWPTSTCANTSEEIDAEELEAVIRLSQAGIGSREEWERANRDLLASFEAK